MKRSKKGGDTDTISSQGNGDNSTVTSALTDGTSKGRTVITCAILLMEAPSASATSSTPAGRKKFEVLQVSFTQDATIRSVLQNVKLQSSHNKDSLASTCVGLCRPDGAEFVNSFSIKKYAVLQNELLLGIPSGLTAAQTARHSENMRKSTKLKALLQSMEIQKTIKSPRAKDTGKGASPEIAPPLSPSYVVHAGPKGSGSPGKDGSDEGSGGSPTADLKALERTGSNLEVKEDRNYGSQVYGENTTGTKRGDDLVGSTTFDKVQDKVSLVRKRPPPTPEHASPSGMWAGEWARDERDAWRAAGTERQQLRRAMEATREAGAPARKKRAAGLRAQVDPIIGSEWRGEVQVSTIRLAADAPTLCDGTTIRDGKGQWLAGVEPSSLGDPIEGTGLHVHPGRPALQVLTESNVKIDLQAPVVREPKLGEVGANLVYDAGATKPYCRVAYFPTTGADNAPLASAAATTLRAVAYALVGGESQADERTGGRYAVGGNAVMQSTPEVTQRVVTKVGSLVVPYTRKDTFLSGVKACISAVATVLGLVADRLHTTFPEVLDGLDNPAVLAGLVKDNKEPFRNALRDLFMFPSHEAQRVGVADPAGRDGEGRSICCHQLAMRLAGEPLGVNADSDCKQRFDPSVQLCALHTDVDDARRANGPPLIYFYADDAADAEDAEAEDEDHQDAPPAETRPMRENDLVVFGGAQGGRAVRIQTACRNHVCVVSFSSAEHMHANVFPDKEEGEVLVPPTATRGTALLRIVPYCRNGIDRYMEQAAETPDYLNALRDGRLIERWDTLSPLD